MSFAVVVVVIVALSIGDQMTMDYKSLFGGNTLCPTLPLPLTQYVAERFFENIYSIDSFAYYVLYLLKKDHMIVILFFFFHCHISIVVPISKAFSIILLFVGLETENINKRNAKKIQNCENGFSVE